MSEEKALTRGELRRQAMLDAASELFLEKGFERTSLSDIVNRSKGSRSTLYEQFGNKEGLLRAMIERATAATWKALGDDAFENLSCEEDLVTLGLCFVNAALAPQSVAVFRVLAAESHRVPETTRLFFELGPRTSERLLSGTFAKTAMVKNGQATPAQLARVFLGGILGVLHARQVLGLPAPQGDDGLEIHVRTAVRIFLDGVGRP